MPITTRCTCSMSLTGFCARDIKDCKQLFLTEMDNCYQMEEKKYQDCPLCGTPCEVIHEHPEGDTPVEELWELFWKPIVSNEDGTINIEQVKKELADFSFIMEQVPKVYCHITGSRMSKVMYRADTVIAVADDYFQEQLEEAVRVEVGEQPGAVWVKGAPTERKLFHARFKGHLSDDIHDGIIEPVKDPEYWQAIASGVRISIKDHHIIEYLDESGQSKEGNKPSVTDITNTLEYYQGVIASLADKEDEAFSKGVHHQRIGMLHEAIETIKKYKQYLQDSPLTQSRADFIREANNRDLGGIAAAPTAWIRADVKRPDGWQLARFLNSRKRFPVKFSPHVIADMVGKTYEPQELEYLSDEGAAAAGREEDGLALLAWLNKNEWGSVGNGEYINHNTGRIIKEEKLYQEFKQQKEK